MSRFGISVKKALGGAVVRNRIKRRVREILRRNRTEIPTGWDIVIHPKSSVAQAAFAPLEAELVRLLRSISTSGGQNTARNNAPRTARVNSLNTGQISGQKPDQKPGQKPAQKSGRNTRPKA
jgi:ribonuclease P protein component